MSDLATRAADCTRCRLSETRQRVVGGSGPITAALALVGEAPGRTEDEGGQPFIGQSGRLLFRLIADEMALTRTQCYVTNVVKCRPPANRTPTTAEVAACRPWWLEQLALLSARVIVTLGNTSTRAILETMAPISTVRGQVFDVAGHVVIPTFHPAAALRGGPAVKAQMRADLRVAAALLASPTP
jgi:uracil-DNA glycosylase